MKKLYFSIASMLVLTLGFAQNKNSLNQSNQINGTTVKTGGFVVNPSPAWNTNNSVPSQGSLNNVVNNGTTTVANPNDHNGHYCKSHQLTQQHYEEMGVWDQSYAIYMSDAASITNYQQNKAAGPNTIPVIFHVVHEGEPVGTGTNVSNAAIMAMFNDLVEDYQLLNADQSQARSAYGFTPADANINFCLAQQDPNGLPLSETGVIRVQTTQTWFNSDLSSEVNAMKSAPLGSPIWDRTKYLNVWICDISNGAGSGTAGYAYRPQGGFLPNANIDGIVVDYNLGVTNDNVLTHEVGHYLGLMHTWGNSGGCSDDDGFTDTPNTYGPSFNQGSSCSGFQQYCSGVQTQYENYMDYSNCTVMFTQQQADYMNMILSTLRSSLFLSPGCDPAGPPVCSFTSSPSGPVTISQNGTVIFQDASTGGPTSWTWTISGTQGTDWAYTGGTNANSQNPEVTFYNTGTYNVTLVASNGFGACTGSTQNTYVTVIAPASGTTCDTLRNWNPLTEGIAWYDNALDWGYLCGHGKFSGFNINEYAEKYTPSSAAEVRRLRVPVMLVEDNSGTGSVNFLISDDDNGGTDPGTILGGVTVPLANLNDFAWNEIDFPTPVGVTGPFWVSVQYNYGSPQDTAVIAIADLGDRPAGVGTTRWYIAGGWYGTNTFYSGGINMSIAWDVLLSNGPAPTASLAVDATELCVGGSIVGNGSGSTNTTNYYWYQTDDNPLTSIYDVQYTAGATFDFSGLTAGDYQLWLFADGSCKTDYDTVDITLYDVPNASVSLTHTTCGQNNGVITFSGATGGNGVYQYSIDGGSNFSSTTTYSNLPAGSYDLVIKTTGDNCEATATVNINSSTAVTGSVTPTVTALCEGQSTTLTASGGTTYTWYNGGTQVQTGTNNTLLVSPLATAQYSVQITNGGCTDLQLATVNVTALDNASFNFADFCDGAPNGPTAIATPGGTWAFNPAPGDGASINPTTGEITNETQITYTVQYTTNGACPNTSTDNVTVSTSDDPTFVTADFCSGSSNTVNITGTTGGTFTYDGADASSINPTTGVITNGVAGTTYNITYTTPAGACQAVSSPIAVTVLTTPTINAVSNQTICSGNSFTAINFTGTGGGTYSWTNNNTNIGLGNNGTGNIAAFAGTTTGASTTATITVTPNNGSCSGTSTNFTLTVNLTPTVGAGTDQSVCDGDQVTLTATNPNSATLSWDNSVTNGVAFTPSVGTTTYTVTATLGSCTAQDQVNVTVDITPSVNAGLNDTICEGTSYTLTATNPNSATITWNNGVSDGVPFTATSIGSTIYTATATIGACSSQDQMILVVNDSPTITGTVTDANGGNNGSIDVTIAGGTGSIVSTNWDSGQTTEDITGIGAGTYTITVTDSVGCSNSETFTVQDIAGIEDLIGADLLIYPNPTSGEFTVQLNGEYQITITDARGRLILQKIGADQTMFDLSSYESGVYFIRIDQNGKMTVRKLMLD
ncbi:MAG: T9SS type A sorting domain-containing protein [Crocinitomicaceae bacterium]|nr:T9SS type A sorting domain-containing protein [Crocinitomicaceae bacterium]